LTLAGVVHLSLAAIFMVVANLLIKNGIAPSLWALLREPPLVACLLISGISVFLWFRILAGQKLSTRYPLFVSIPCSFLIIGVFCPLHEKVSIQELMGPVVIIIGITTVTHG
jgi:multidrug transporter EmrE-like cation transporter